MCRIRIGFILIVLTLYVLPCYAEGDLTRVTYGSETKHVIALIGEPTEKIEREAKREVVWYYPTGSIVFSKGRAKSVFIDGISQDRFSQEYLRLTQPAKPDNSKGLNSPVEDILSEILREVPSEGGAETASPSAPGEVKPLDIIR
jgi:hypothetical protein